MSKLIVDSKDIRKLTMATAGDGSNTTCSTTSTRHDVIYWFGSWSQSCRLPITRSPISSRHCRHIIASCWAGGGRPKAWRTLEKTPITMPIKVSTWEKQQAVQCCHARTTVDQGHLTQFLSRVNDLISWLCSAKQSKSTRQPGVGNGHYPKDFTAVEHSKVICVTLNWGDWWECDH